MAAGRISPSCETSKLEDSSMERYSPWREVAGCFDGDGSACVSIMKYVLKVRLCFYDVWRPQLEAIKTFFEWKGVSTRSLAVRHKKLGDIWYLTISDAESIDAIARKILPFSCKNRGDLLVALDYRDDKIAAEHAVAKLNESVHDKRRSGQVRKASIPCTRSEGTLVGRRRGAEAGTRAVAIDVPRPIQGRILKDRTRWGRTLPELQLKYGYSIHVIRRVLRNTRAFCVLRKPIG